MKYINAAALLPEELVKELQKYIQGGYIYVPAIPEQRKCWGEASGSRKELLCRNSKILEEYQNGISIEKLADKYYLSVHAVRKIIYKN